MTQVDIGSVLNSKRSVIVGDRSGQTEWSDNEATQNGKDYNPSDFLLQAKARSPAEILVRKPELLRT